VKARKDSGVFSNPRLQPSCLWTKKNVLFPGINSRKSFSAWGMKIFI